MGTIMTAAKTGLKLNKRQTQIVDMVQQQGFAAVEELAQGFDVTPQTIRRDINELCTHGHVRRFHGGVGIASSVENVAYDARRVLLLEEKQRIGREVARHIPNQASVFIDIGTTTEEVARALLDHEGLRVITNDLNIATILSGNPTCEVIIAGGVVRSRDRGITGEATIDFIRQFKVDFGIISVSAIDSDGALLDFDYHEVRVAQAIIENSRKVFLAADHSKFGRNAVVRLGHLSQIHALFSDQQPSEEIVGTLAEHNVTLHVAEPKA